MAAPFLCRAAASGDIDPLDQTAAFHALFEAAVAAVQTGFPHLSAEAIAEPPHHWLDAALARQIALHIMVRWFDVPKGRIARLHGRSREALHRAMRQIDDRIEDPTFARQYERMTMLTERNFRAVLKEAA